MPRLGPDRPEVYAVASLARLDSTSDSYRIEPAVAGDHRVSSFDGERPAADGDGTLWRWTEDLAVRHASQFDAAGLAALAAVPNAERAVHLRPVLEADPRYTGFCSP